MSQCKTLVYYDEFTNEVEVCNGEAKWQDDRLKQGAEIIEGSFSVCDEHKYLLVDPKPISDKQKQI